MNTSIIIPFYNEGKNIPLLLKELQDVFEGMNQEYEIILVDDGSDEPVGELKFKHIRLFSHKKRLGKGEALRTGVKIHEIFLSLCKK